ncbi:unnamed protein product [Laminaria digitata]
MAFATSGFRSSFEEIQPQQSHWVFHGLLWSSLTEGPNVSVCRSWILWAYVTKKRKSEAAITYKAKVRTTAAASLGKKRRHHGGKQHKRSHCKFSRPLSVHLAADSRLTAATLGDCLHFHYSATFRLIGRRVALNLISKLVLKTFCWRSETNNPIAVHVAIS